LKKKINNSYPAPNRRGFSFALHLLKVQGFSSARQRISHAQAFTVAFLPSMQFIRPKRQNRLQGLAWAFPLI
jgi:hypothetical protein